MQSRELFGFSVRFLGFVSCLYGVYDAFFVGVQLLGVQLQDDYPPALVIFAAGFFLALGIVLIRAADWFVQFAYGPAWPDK
jgi:hypothetical protein